MNFGGQEVVLCIWTVHILSEVAVHQVFCCSSPSLRAAPCAAPGQSATVTPRGGCEPAGDLVLPATACWQSLSQWRRSEMGWCW